VERQAATYIRWVIPVGLTSAWSRRGWRFLFIPMPVAARLRRSVRRMKPMRFQTDRRLWLWVSLALLAVIWLFVPIGIKSESYRPIVLLWDWIGYIFNSDRREVFGVGVMLLIFACLSSIVAAVIGWPLHALIVVMRHGKRGDG
jgi:hypothetical protein